MRKSAIAKVLASDERCYMCTSSAVSHEHVPPRCLFPAASDVGRNLRYDLITVPACADHNMAKSKDDEFLMIALAGVVGNNSIGYQHAMTKVDRALRRSSGRLLASVVLKQKGTKRIDLGGNRFLEMILGTPDVARLLRCFDHIARGLHHHHFGTRFVGQVKTHFGYLIHEAGDSRTWAELLRDQAEIDLQGRPTLGANPDVFEFQVTDYDENGLFLIRMRFYGGLNVYSAFIPAASEPPATLLSYLLSDTGIKKVLTLGDKKYRLGGDRGS